MLAFNTWQLPRPFLAILAFLEGVMRFAYLDPAAGTKRESGRSGGTPGAFGGMTRVASGEYNFATQGGAVSTINLHSDDIPAGAIVRRAWIDVITILASGGAATVSLGIEGAADLLAATAFNAAPFSTATPKDLPLAAASPAIKSTAVRKLRATIAAAALTGGRFRLYVEYVDTRA